MSNIWLDVRLFLNLIVSSREAWERQGRKRVAGLLELVCTWFKVVASVSEVGSVWRIMSCDQGPLCVEFFPNLLQTSGFYGEQNHREPESQHEIECSLARPMQVAHHRERRGGVKTDFFSTESGERTVAERIKRADEPCAHNKTEPLHSVLE